MANSLQEAKTEVRRMIRAEDERVSLTAALGELWRYRELLLTWTQRNIKVRYKQSLLGAAWAILQPLSMMIIFSVIFTYFVRVPTEGIPYPIFSYTALLPWTFFASAISFGVPSVVTKIYFPREIFPIAAVAVRFVDFLVASVVFPGDALLPRAAGVVVLFQVSTRHS